METSPKHNPEFCNKDSRRCIHCCSLDYGVSKEYYRVLFARRRDTFDRTVKNFPADLGFYIQILGNEQAIGQVNPCKYLGMVDENPGCMIHPSRHEGADIRSDEELIKTSCVPEKGCYFNNYFRTPAERKILAELTSNAGDWFSYSESLRNAAVFNKQAGYVLSRLPLESVSIEQVSKVMNHIHEKLRKKFPRKDKKPISKDSGLDISAIIDELNGIGPTENYMQNSPLFKKWGYEFGVPLKNEHPYLEKRFKPNDFSEWGYYGDREKIMYVHKPSGQILPIQFNDVAITRDEEVRKAMNITNGIIGSYCRKK